MTIKKLFVLLILSLVLICILTSCSKKPDISVTNENIKESVTPTPEEKTEPDPDPLKILNISKWGYDSLEYINHKFLFAKSGNKWILVSSATGKQVEWPFKYGDDEYKAEFDTVYMNLQSACFIGVIAEEDGTYTSALFDPDAEVIMFKLHRNAGYLVDYRDNLIIAETADQKGKEYYYIISLSEGDYGYTAYKKDKLSFLRSSYGVLNFSFSTFYSDIKTCGWRFNSYDVRDYIDDIAEDKDRLLDYAESVNNTYKDKAVQVWPNTTNQEGWVRASVFDVGYDDYGSPRLLKETEQAGFYNLLSQDFIKTPDDSDSCIFFMTGNGSTRCTVTDSRAAIEVKRDKSSDADEAETAYRIFDLRTKTWANEDLYLSVKAFGYHKYVRVQKLNGKWAFLDDATMKPIGERYDVATDFCNGYALAVRNNRAFIINEKFKQISESFWADGVGSALDYLEFSDLDGEAVFFARLSDGLYHMVTFEQEQK